MRYQKLCVWAALAVLALGAAACGGSSGTTPAPDPATDSCNFTNSSSAAILGTSTDTSFATNGQFTLAFVAEDSSGTAVLAGSDCGASAQVIEAATFGDWKKTSFKAATTTAVSCTITAPTNTTSGLTSVAATRPSGSGAVFGAALIDDSGSMAGSDSTNARDPAADAFLDSICATATNMFGVFDFGAGNNMSFTDTRDLLTADGVMAGDITGANSVLPYVECAAGNVTRAKTAIGNQITADDGTPLWESVLELCTDIAAKRATGGQLAGLASAMLVLSDGEPNSTTNQAAAESCVSTNGIITCTVGLGPGSEVSGTADPAAVAALKSLAAAGSCVYASATDAAALTPIFNAIGTGVSQGFNSAIFQLSPIPATGTTVTGTLTVGSATATFTFIAP